MMINKFTFYLILLLLIPFGVACSDSADGENELSEEIEMTNQYYAFVELEDQNGETMGKVKIELYADKTPKTVQNFIDLRRSDVIDLYYNYLGLFFGILTILLIRHVKKT